MNFPNLFIESETQKIISRINALKPDDKPLWGKMNAAQMLAHLNVAYQIANDEIQVKYNFILKFLFKIFLKPIVVGAKPYKKNSQTAPIFIITDEKEFEAEKNELIKNLALFVQLGEEYFEGKESPSFGAMTAQEWNNQFYKHADYHLQQFGI